MSNIEAKVSALVARAMHKTTGVEEGRTCAMLALKLMTENNGKIVFSVASNPESDFWENLKKAAQAKARAEEEAQAARQAERDRAQKEYEQRQTKKPGRRAIYNKFSGFCANCKTPCPKGVQVFHSAIQKNIICGMCFQYASER